MSPRSRKKPVSSGKPSASDDAFSIKELLDASPATISLIDTQKWQVRFQNCASRNMFGDLIGKSCHENIGQMPTRCSFCRATEALQTGKTTGSEVTMPDGRCLLIQWAPVRRGSTIFSVETITDITDHKRKEEEFRRLTELFEHQATVDPLTELLNRRGWTQLAERVWWRAIRTQEPMEVLLLDLDHFKAINDKWGHQAGDTVLKHLAGILRQQVRPGDLVGRWGGEEFIILLYPPTGDLRRLAERIREAVESFPVRVLESDTPITVTVSIGGTVFDPAGKDAGGLDMAMAGADRNLYRAKQLGRNRVCL